MFAADKLRLTVKKREIPAGAGRCLAAFGSGCGQNAIQRIEAGKRFVMDIELVHLAKVLNASCEDLLEEKK